MNQRGPYKKYDLREGEDRELVGTRRENSIREFNAWLKADKYEMDFESAPILKWYEQHCAELAAKRFSNSYQSQKLRQNVVTKRKV